jgi:hypothetical protein
MIEAPKLLINSAGISNPSFQKWGVSLQSFKYMRKFAGGFLILDLYRECLRNQPDTMYHMALLNLDIVKARKSSGQIMRRNK